MTTITTTCTGCGRQLAVPDRYQGRDLKCPSCGHPFRVDVPRTKPDSVVPDPTAAAPELQPLPLGASPFEEPSAPGSEEAGTFQTEFVEATAVFWRVKRIAVASLAAVSGLIHAAAGLLAGLVVAVVSFIPAAEEIPIAHGPLLAGLAIVLLPLVCGAVGFALGALMAVVYNLAARLFGGVKLLLE
ncbi:MAG: hypothetical protein ABR961_08720 [Thermoanaerobaculaceae bacterium]|jgi:predicted RNA-binding Zn-ribbon protein involved in translation (DUF1610 family)